MYSLIKVIHIVVSVILVLIILLQSGKGAGLSGLLGGGGGEQLFSAPSGGSFLRKVTITLAVIFILTSLSMTFMASKKYYRSVTVTEQR